ILGKAVGRTAVEAFNDLAIGIGRQSRLILDNLGVIVRAEEAYENYAKSVGKAVGELTQQEQREAFRVAALESVRKKVASLGEDTLSSSEKFAQFNVELKEAWATISKELQPALLELAKALGGVVKAVSPLVKLL
ncbi:hypothetical protein GWN75_31980, partial [candidate division KSB1 bacterium]|nr:hypothetical protein [candidate division KSB1 bacterium]NIU29028.1 hypothetical protein [candidate division KSB1 bacterium]NIW22920.1 hypothetical protein [candidate division KSB1 bacterium]